MITESRLLVKNTESDGLIRKYELCREQFGNALLRREILIQVLKPDLEAMYFACFGNRLLELKTLKLVGGKLKRTIELIQADMNKGMIPEIENIDVILGQEFLQWEIEIRIFSQAIIKADILLSGKIEDNYSKELRRLYKELAKRIHPDLCPIFSRRNKTIWNQVQSAFQNSDLDEIRLLFTLVTNKDFIMENIRGTELSVGISHLQKQLSKLFDEINEIKSKYPLTIENNLQDKYWIAEEIAKINREIEAIKPYTKRLELQLSNLLLIIENGKQSRN